MKNWLIILSAIAFGCARHDPPDTKKSYVIHFEMAASNQVIVTAIININVDKPDFHPQSKRLAIDTGAAHTSFFVPVDAVSDLHRIFPQSTFDERMAADGNAVHVCHFPTGRLTIGDLSVDMPVDASGYDMKVDPEFDGVVGLDLLSRFKVGLDFQSKTMILTER